MVAEEIKLLRRVRLKGLLPCIRVVGAVVASEDERVDAVVATTLE
jgi:hypothetical protein